MSLQFLPSLSRTRLVICWSTVTPKVQRKLTVPNALNLVVTCTKRKRRTVPRELRLQDVRPSPIENRAREWLTRLRTTAVEPMSAEQLYAGDHWCVVRSLAQNAKSWGYDVRL